MTRALALIVLLLLSGCAGWSSWEEQRGAAAPPPPVGEGEYRVVRGDTVYSIAFRHSLDYREMANWNGIGSDYLIHPGQVLRLTPPSRRHVTGEIEGVGMNDVSIGKPQPATPNSGPPKLPPLKAGELPPARTGDYAWVWPAEGALLRDFAASSNRGIDIGGRNGQPVFAAAPGRVVYSGNALKGYGELIIVKHDDVYLSAYGYNRSRHVKEGDLVTAGQPIAEMGRGPENKPLLHFEIRRNGKPIDPVGVLGGGQSAAR